MQTVKCYSHPLICLSLCSLSDLSQCFDQNCNNGHCSRFRGSLSYPCQCRTGYSGQFCDIQTVLPPTTAPPTAVPTTTAPPTAAPSTATDAPATNAPATDAPATDAPTTLGTPAPPFRCHQVQNPCNGGICVDNFFGVGFSCTRCPEGFSGQFCNFQLGKTKSVMKLSNKSCTVEVKKN